MQDGEENMKYRGCDPYLQRAHNRGHNQGHGKGWLFVATRKEKALMITN